CHELRNVSAECVLAECRMGAIWRLKRHNGAMPSVQIKDVPEQTHAILRARAAAAHQSLQEYLRSRLIEEASQPSLDEILDRAGDQRRAALALTDLIALPLRRAPHRVLVSRCWELRDNLTIYDAAYVALAEMLAADLLTGDTRLANAPKIRCRIEVLR